MNYSWKKKLSAVLASSFVLAASSVGFAEQVELTLDDSVNMALKNNPSISISLDDREAAKWNLRSIEADTLPAISVSHRESRGGSAATGTVSNYYLNTVETSWYIYTGGQQAGGIKKAQVGLKAADVDVSSTRQQVKLDATSGYFTLLKYRELLKVSQQSVDDYTAHLRNVQAQFEVGTVAKSDLLRSEVELANAQQNLVSAQNAYSVAMASLNRVLGLPMDTELVLKEELKQEPFGMTLEDALSYAMTNRSDLNKAGLGVESAKADVMIAKSGFMPKIALGASKQWDDSRYPGDNYKSWTASLTASLNLFDWGSTNADIKKSQAGLKKAVTSVQQAKDYAGLDVRQNYLDMKAAEKKIGTNAVSVTKAEEDFKIAQVRYNAGVGTNLDVIDAELALTNARTNYIQALYEYNTSKAKLEKAIGIEVK